MGMFDSVEADCPKCKANIEIQSKAGPCMLARFPYDEVPVAVADDVKGDVIKCQFCNTNWLVIADVPTFVKIDLVKTKVKEDYPGNYNPKLPENIKRMKELKKMIRGENE